MKVSRLFVLAACVLSSIKVLAVEQIPVVKWNVPGFRMALQRPMLLTDDKLPGTSGPSKQQLRALTVGGL